MLTASVIVGCDVGGTFTDLILYDPSGGGLKLAKVPTTTANQAHGVLAALEKTGQSADNIDLFIHGTTATTNAVLERKLARCGLITTRGFRDVLELGRRTRPTPYGLIGTFEPIIPRDMRFEVTERLDARGRIIIPLVDQALVNLHSAIIGKRAALPNDALTSRSTAARVEDALTGSRNVWFDDAWCETPIYARDRLPLDSEFEGPAILEQLDATTVVHPGNRVRIDQFGNVILQVMEIAS